MQAAAEPARNSDDDEAAAPHDTMFGQGGYVAPHKGLKAQKDTYLLMNPVYSPDYVRSVRPKHTAPTTMHQKVRSGTTTRR